MRLITLLSTALLLLLCTCVSAQEGSSRIPLDLKYWGDLAPRSIGPAGMSGRVTAIDVHPQNKDIFYVGTASGGLWTSRNGGISFEPIFDRQKYLGIGAVAVSDANPSIVWAGTGEGNPRNSASYGGGIYKSPDGGKSWQHMGLEATRHIHRVIAHPTDPDVAYVGALGSMWGPNKERGVYRTTDGGKTWENVLFIDEGTGIADLVMDPTNPRKIIAATWTFDRDPDFFNSGGPGSGIWITHDGGDTWERRTAKDGLPMGDLGRIGLAIAASKPNVVYALVEAKVNGLYKSTDGGSSWKLVTDKNIGDRPFYYAEIYVDPKNENRIFDVATYVSRSEDGGRTFQQIANYGNSVHPDHHAFWIDNDDPSFILDGNDGGMNISRDGGDTWHFAANLPLAQFYHINYDLSFPYNIGGGMQDNGSWVGPSQGLKSGGITDADWQEVYFGDGFDLIFKPSDPNTVYAASQGGALGRVNRRTGKTTGIRPVHPDGTFLRFNWNAPIGQSPTNDCTIYIGSQFVHKSTDCGNSWTIISPDLTTNDSTKQRQMSSGGLTIDATQAENHTTLLAIVPNRVGYGDNTLWVSSDDGKLHLTRDGGKNWTDLSKRLPGMTPGSWIPYIEPSPHRASEAFVVVNDYRRNDRQPMVFHTTDYGETFTRLVDESDVSGHALSIVQDPVEPKLLFLGTDQGLWVSFNYGKDWTHYNHTFPNVSVRDLKIHPREHDLIIGTFGRAAWILDDIRPFRAIAQSGVAMLRDSFAVFPAPDAYQWDYRSYQGTRFYAQGQFQGQDRRGGAMLSFYVLPASEKEKMDTKAAPAPTPAKGKKGEKAPAAPVAPSAKEPNVAQLLAYPVVPADEMDAAAQFSAATMARQALPQAAGPNPVEGPKGKVKIQVVDVQTGDTIRTYRITPQWGMNRTSWNMRRDGVSFPSRREAREDADPSPGASVTPGVYEVVMTYGTQMGKTMLTVHADPREKPAPNAFAEREKLQAELDTTIVRVDAAWTDLRNAGKSIKTVQGLLADAPAAVKDSLQKAAKDLLKQIADLEEIYTEKEDLKGIQRNPTNLQSKLFEASRYIRQVEGQPSQMATVSLEHFQNAAADFVNKVELFMGGDFAAFRRKVAQANLSLFGKL